MIAIRDDPDSVVGVCCKLLKVADDTVGWDGCLWLFGDGDEGTIVTEHEQTLFCLAVLTEQLRAVWQRCGV